MNRFKKFISKIGGEDKLLHVETSCLIALFVGLLLSGNGATKFITLFLSALFSISAGFLKEIYDATHGEFFDKKDLVADCIGVVVGLLIIFILL